ncbi:Squalene synthase [Wickerhamiella sorbophila]|uniref:squalene synthase n=1 Tax=Wickerhamiella sorbophila TaxID=45607 RepID=A0A2T0FLZ6_9ASCO|nr:Squalene synthase [Wickerhamiella sorbophila]PRT56000.1 Squalene synthase [Wickerhamiella sorbophila]
MISLDELLVIIQLKLSRPLHPVGTRGRDLTRCYELLRLTSRSFASVIEQLHPELRDAMMIFYVVLRGLDTVEDDTGLDNKVKLPLLRSFRNVLKTEDWTFHDSSETEKDRVVLQEFDCILREYHKLRPEYQDIIADITEKMGNGMADYIAMENQQNFEGVKTVADYDLYCHHVAGIVGEGITRMAVYSKFGDRKLAEKEDLFESMGLFLQKTNIIRDYREDIDDGRSFWPREVWSKYADSLTDFTKKEHTEKGLQCISELTLHSLRHVEHVLEYLSAVRDESLFRFCAIPQTMSIATLELVFNNPEVFQSNVKISKGQAAKLILGSRSMAEVYAIFRHYVRKIHERNKVTDPNFLHIEQRCAKIEQYINANDKFSIEYIRMQALPKSEFERDQLDSANKVMYTGFGMLLVVSGLMVGIASYFSGGKVGPSRFIAEFKTFIDFMWN